MTIAEGSKVARHISLVVNEYAVDGREHRIILVVDVGARPALLQLYYVVLLHHFEEEGPSTLDCLAVAGGLPGYGGVEPERVIILCLRNRDGWASVVAILVKLCGSEV